MFDALFSGYDFTSYNPVAQIIEQMLATLDEQSLDTENSQLAGFYDSVRQYVDGINTAEGRQAIIMKLYENFFATAFKRTVDKLGIVHTPVEIVEFILRSADEVLRQEFGQGLTDENVHIVDGFTGSGNIHGPAHPVRFDHRGRSPPQVPERVARQRDPAARLLHRRRQHRVRVPRRSQS